jgi:hypothetical protein
MFFRNGVSADDHLNRMHFSEIKHLRFGSQIDQMGSAIQDHVGQEFFLVDLTSIGTRNSDANRHLVFDQVGQVVIRAITGGCFHR